MKTLVIGAVQAYLLIAVVIAAPYFNWQYAKSEGFASWFCLGEVVPLCQSFAWPYYLVASERDDDSATHAAATQQAQEAVAQAINKHRGLKGMTQAQLDDLYQLAAMAASEAELVSDEYLLQAHPELPRRYREQLVPALQHLAQAIRGGSELQVFAAGESINNFLTWSKENIAE